MKILLLGGTGAIGEYLARSLKSKGNDVIITTRTPKSNDSGIRYILGNAKDYNFIQSLSACHYDCVVDFMVYSTKEFSERSDALLQLSDHYIYLSSARVFANSCDPIVESSPRILDVTNDQDYLGTDEYALAKARQENILRENQSEKWTIVRPYITYGDKRLQLTVMEKEDWLSRAIEGKKIIFCDELLKKNTTMTYGNDVARMIESIIDLAKITYSEEFNLVNNTNVTWNDVINLYSAEMLMSTGRGIKLHMVHLQDFLSVQKSHYQVMYDRIYDRIFDNRKVMKILGTYDFSDITVSLPTCLRTFLNNPQFSEINPILEAQRDKITKDFSNLAKFSDLKNKLKYIYHRIK